MDLFNNSIISDMFNLKNKVTIINGDVKEKLQELPDEFFTLIITYAYRDMDFVKNKLGVEVQFGKYSFMVYNVCAKMTIFKNLGVINAGIEIVPIKNLACNMSSGVSYFEQFVWDLNARGTSNIDTSTYIGN